MCQGFPRWLSGKESACKAGDTHLIPGGEDPLEEEMATHSSILTWKIPWTEEPGGLPSPWGQSESDTATELTSMHDSVPPMVLGSGDVTVRNVKSGISGTSLVV